MLANLLTAVLFCALVFVVALGVAIPASATSQTSAATFRQQEPTGLLRPDEAAEVARAFDEADLGIGSSIRVDVVVDEDGRRASTDWMIHVPEVGGEYATETPMPVLAEDVNDPDGIVILVNPFERTGSFVEAPGLSDRDERYLSKVMTSRFRRGSYDDGLTAVAHGLEARLAPLPQSPPYREPSTPRTVSGVAVTLFAGGIAAVVLLLGYFLKSERYRRLRGPDRGVAFVAARHDAETILSVLAPRVMLLAEKEMTMLDRLKNLEESVPDGPIRRRAEGLLRGAVSDGFWERFVRVTALVEEDPEEALAGLRGLSTEIETTLVRLGEAERTLCGSRLGDGPDGGGRDVTRRS